MGTWIVILILMAAILVFAFSALPQGSPPPDPFLPYSDLLSSDLTLIALADRKYSCIDIFSGILRTSCSFKPNDPLFSIIYVNIKQDVPESVVFEVVKNTLQVGDLVLLWGKPDMASIHGLFWPKWEGVTVSALVPSADRLNYLAPVSVVIFTF